MISLDCNDPLDAVQVDRYGLCRWSHVTRVLAIYQNRIEEMEDALQEIATRLPIMDGVTAIQMRAIARLVLPRKGCGMNYKPACKA